MGLGINSIRKLYHNFYHSIFVAALELYLKNNKQQEVAMLFNQMLL